MVELPPITIQEASKILGVSPKTLRRWEKQGLITPKRTLGNQRRYHHEHLQSLLHQRIASKRFGLTNVRRLFSFSPAQKISLISVLSLTFAAISLFLLNRNGLRFSLPFIQFPQNVTPSDQVKVPEGIVLAAETSPGSLELKVNIPSLFASTATVAGELTAPNIIYSVNPGAGIEISAGQNPTITNTDLGSAQKFFSLFEVSGEDDITAGSNSDALTIVAGNNITLSTNATDKELTIAASVSNSSGWTDDGSIVRLSTLGDSVSIGIATSESKLNVFGSTTGKALALFNETGDQSPLTASVSGITIFNISNSGVASLFSGTATADLIKFVSPTTAGAQFTGNITTSDITSSDKTWTFPDATGTVCLTTNNCAGSTNYWQLNSNVLAPGNAATVTDRLVLGGNSSTVHQFEVSSKITGKALASLNETGDQNILVASASGSNVFLLDRSGNITTSGTVQMTGFKLTTGASSGYFLVSDGFGVGSWTDISTSGTAGPWTLSGSTLFPDVATYNLLVGSTSVLDDIGKTTISGTKTGKALTILNDTGTDQNILAASASGTNVFILDRSGNVLTPAASRHDTLSAGALNLGTTTATSLALGSASVTAMTFTTDTNAASDFTFTGGIHGSTTIEVNGNTIGLNNDADVDNLIGVAAAAGAANSSLYWGNSLLCTFSDTNCGWVTSTQVSNYWQYSTANGTLAPGNLTVDTLFGSTATSSARLILGGSITGGKASLIVNQLESQDIFTASVSGAPRFAIGQNSDLNLFPYGTSAGNTGEIRFYELAATGTNYVGFKSPDQIDSSNKIWTLPNADSSGSQCLSSNGSLVLGWSACSGSSSSNFWQYSTTNGTLAPGNLTVDTLFGSTATSSARLIVAGSITGGKSSLIVNQTESQDIFSASASGVAKFTIGNSGNFTIPSQTSLSSITSTQTTTNVFQISATSLTQGYAQVLSVNGSTSLTTGGAINIDGPTGAATLDATTGLVNISSTGAITNTTTGAGSGSLFQITGNGAITPTLASISDTSIMTTTGKLLDLTANAATTTTGLLTMNATGLTQGFAQNINVNGAATLTSGGALNIVGPTGAAAISGGLVQISATGAFTSTANVGGLLNLSASGTATGTIASIAGNALTTGTGFNLYSTSTVLTTGKLGYFNWEPSAVATASGDLVGINIGSAGDTTGNLFNITSAATSLFSVSETAITSALPHSFTAAGDVSLAYDLLFTNQTASYVKSSAPLYIQAGETFESNNLTLKSYNTGNIIFDTDTAGKVLVGTGSASLKFTVSDSFAATAAAMIENQYNGNDADGLVVKLGYTGNGAASNRFLVFLNGIGTPVGRIESTTGLGVAYQTSGIDFAEYFVKDSTQFEEGDIVTIKSNGATKSNTFFDPNMVGIVSASPGFKGGEEGANKVLVGLVGQVPLKISPASDSISPGDLLTSSADPGRAVKATRPGFTIAKALESWSPGSGKDKILTFVNPVWADPNHTLTFDENGNLTFSSLSPKNQDDLAGVLFDSQVNATFSGTLTAREIIADNIKANHIDGLSLLIASASAQSQITPTPSPSDQTILSSLKINQSAEIGLDLRVLGQLQVEGALTVTGEVNFIGQVFFNRDTAGFATIPQGSRYVTVNYEKEYLQPPVVTTNPIWDTDSNVLGVAIDQPVSLLPKQDYIIAASNTTGFTILLEQPAVIDLKFSWTAIAVKDPRTISAPDPTPIANPTPTLEPSPTPPI